MTDQNTKSFECDREQLDLIIRDLRRRLLDLGLNNRVLNFRFSERSRNHVRIIDEFPGIFYEKLVNGQSLVFKALPEPENEPEDEKTDDFLMTLDAVRLNDEKYLAEMEDLKDDEDETSPRGQEIERVLRDRVRKALGLPRFSSRETMTPAEYARTLNLNPSYDLPAPGTGGETSTKRSDSHIQTLLFPEQMQRKLSAVADGARLSEKEAGVNALFVSFGFLEWYASKDSYKKLYAPLLLHPVKIDKKPSRRYYQYSIQTLGEESVVNICLKERLARNFKLNLPGFKEGDSTESYFNKVEKVISAAPYWRLRRFATIGLFSFSRQAMYHDLDPNRWPDGEGVRNHPVLRRLLGGPEIDDNPFAMEYEVDEPEVAGKVPSLIFDADSSQTSAIVDVMEGKNLAITGPPGTGKSQTIANLISASIEKGKKVLFVGEKMAALEVVKKRLDQAGLGDFCLELHSDKARKKDVFESLNDRRNLKAFPEPVELEQAIEQLEEFKEILSTYATDVNRPFCENGGTLHDLLWGALLAREKVNESGVPEQVLKLKLKKPQALTVDDLNSKRELLSAVEKISLDFFDKWKSVGEHPWTGFRRSDLSRFDREEILKAMKTWLLRIADLQAVCQFMSEDLGGKAPSTLTEAKVQLKMIHQLQDDVHGIDANILPFLKNKKNLETLEVFLRLLEDCRAIKNRIAHWLKSPHAGRPSLDDAAPLSRECGRLTFGKELFKGRIGDLPKLAGKCIKNSRAIKSIADRVNLAQKALGCSFPLLPGTFLIILKATKLLRTTPRMVILLRRKELFEETVWSFLKSATQEAGQLRRRQKELQGFLKFSGMEDPDELCSHAMNLEEAGFFSRLFGRPYSEAKKEWKMIRKVVKKTPPRRMAQELEDLALHLRKLQDFDHNNRLRKLLRNNFVGVNTNFDVFLAVGTYARKIESFFSGSKPENQAFQHFLLNGSQEAIDAFLAEVGDLNEKHFAYIRRLMDMGKFQETERINLKKVERFFALQAERAKYVYKTACDLGVNEDARIAEFSEFKDALARLEKIEKTISEMGVVKRIIGKHYNGSETNGELISPAVKFARKVRAQDLPEWIFDRLMHENAADYLSALKKYQGRLFEAVRNEEEAFKVTVRLGHIDLKYFYGCKNVRDVSIRDAEKRIKYALHNPNELASWARYVRARDKVAEAHLGNLIKVYEEENKPMHGLKDVFDHIYYRAVVKEAFHLCPFLSEFTGSSHEDIRQQFQNLDRRIMDLSRLKIASKLSRGPIDQGLRGISRNEDTGLIHIVQEIGKQKRKPLRNLFERAGKAVQDMKPCWMASPAAIAMHLKPGVVEFDLVVIDEASQIKPENALGAIVRGRQLVVVGDPKQLPPTSFFERMDLPAEEEENDVEGNPAESESILDMALNKFPAPRKLKWHYRSKHESLIAFSNNYFYDGGLIVFPSAKIRDENLGVKFEFVKAGGYSKNCVNLLEAKAVAEAALLFMKENAAFPETRQRSLGIVTVNQSQREILRDEINRLVRRDPIVGNYLQRWEKTLEPFFVKNLENIQGDERDVIFASMVYGPNETGRVMQRFGPINSWAGHRRLNVLFTRAREQTVVFSSMEATDITPQPTSNEGLYILKYYLDFAQKGRLDAGEVTGREPDSNFELFVAERLKNRGYQVVPKVGVSGCYVDLGVRRPHDPGSFLCAVECDGANYGSAKSARDRDRLRQEALESLGWRVYRIWSPDWFEDPDRETDKLVHYLDQIAGTRLKAIAS